jgi:hypothetical protein
MGIRINSVNSVLRPAAQRTGMLRFPAAAQDDSAVRAVSPAAPFREGEGRYASPPGFRGGDDTPRLGFGPGTVSPAGAAASTLRRQVAEMRQFAPNLREMFTRVRGNEQPAGAEPRRGTGEDVLVGTRDTAETRRESVNLSMNRADATARTNARDFINALNDAARLARDRVQGSGEESRGLRTRPLAERLAGYRPQTAFFPNVDLRV